MTSLSSSTTLTLSGKAPLILVVEDERMTSRTVQVILEQSGFRVRCAFSLAEAMAALKEQRPNLILLDISLPDGNGFEVCQHLKQEAGLSKIPVLFMSAHEDVETKIHGFEVGGVDYITKPVAGAELIARVTTHLRLSQAYEQLAELQAERIQRLAGAQEALMPQPADLPDARFAIQLRQILRAGGDFYDVIPVGQGIVDYVVADASGHDLAASFWTAALKTLIAQNAQPENRPLDIVHAINNSLRRILPSGVFFTLIYVRINRNKNHLTLISAAHPPLIVVPKDGTTPYALEQPGDIVGVFEDALYDSCKFTLKPGDRLLLYSDGLVELTGDAGQGQQRLLEAASTQRGLALNELVKQLVEDLCRGQQIGDDIVLMGIEL
ncbi:MAG: SpoIIE family protein phosphatase [Desulfuromonadaceae bacterium]|nr:SpoIIE family protein phosphatase [Desulfuromonadaceae bacterium]